MRAASAFSGTAKPEDEDFMLETEEKEDTLVGQFRSVIKDGIDYLGSVLTLAQARATEVILSGAVAGVMLVAGAFIAMGAAVLLVVAFGIWLAHAVGSAALALLILGGVLALVAVVLVMRAMAWIGNLKS